MNHYACYALKSEEGFAYSDPVEHCSFNGGTEFTFGMDFYSTGEDGVLFSQKDSISCQIQNNQLEWRGTDWCLSTSSASSPLIEDGWNHVDIVYGKDSAALYLNGISVQEHALTGEGSYSEEPYHYLEQDIGYVRNVRMIDHALTQEEIITNLLSCTIPEEKLWLWIPFDVPYCQDQGKTKKSVHYQGLSRCETIVGALCFDGSGYARLDEVTVNPGDASIPEFSVALRIFSLPCSTKEAVLFENKGGTDLFRISLMDGQTKIKIRLGQEEQTLADSAIPPYQWTDVIICRKGKEVLCIVNGESAGTLQFSGDYQRTSSPSLILGDNFTGYMDYAGIYGKQITLEEGRNIHQTEPYVFDDDIRLLFLFHGEKTENLLGSGTLLLQKNIKLALTEGTVYEEKIEPMSIRTKSGFSGNDFEKWEADFLSDVIVQFCSQSVGISADNINIDGGTKEYIWNRLKDLKEAQDLFIDYTVFTPEEIVKLMGVTVIQQAALQVLTTAMVKGTIIAASAVNIEKIMQFQFALGITAAAAFITKAAVKAKSKTKDPEEPPFVPYPPEPEKGYQVEILSLQFCCDDKGSIPLRKDWINPQDLPEWKSGAQSAGICAYVPVKQSPKIKIKFRFTRAKDQEPVSVQIGVKSDLLGECLSSSVLCDTARDYDTEAVFDGGKLESADMGKHPESLRLYYCGNGSQKFSGTADMAFHILAGVPKSPWSTSVPTHAPVIFLLEYAAEIAAGKPAIKEAKGFLDAAVDWYGSRTGCKLEAAPKYSRRTWNGAEFCFTKFADAFASRNVSAGELDYYMFLVDIAAMEGLSLTVYEISSMETAGREKEKLTVQFTGINRHDNTRIWGADCPSYVRNSYLISDKLSQSASYWDLLLRQTGTNTSWKNTSWQTYRKEAIAKSSFAYAPAPLTSWSECANLPDRRLQIIYNSFSHLFVGSARWDFKQFIKDAHHYDKNLACCHRISYHTIEEILIFTYNKLGQDEITAGEKDTILELLLNVFYPDGEPNENEDPDNNQNYTELTIVLDKLRGIDTLNLKDVETCKQVSDLLGTVLCCLNSAPANLRDGYVSWNSSIGSCYDPSEWTTVLDGKEIFSQKGTVTPQIPTEVSDGIYLTDEADGRGIHTLKMIESILEEELLQLNCCVYTQWLDDNQYVEYPALYSSLNEFRLEDVECHMLTASYFYKNPETGEWSEIFQ